MERRGEEMTGSGQHIASSVRLKVQREGPMGWMDEGREMVSCLPLGPVPEDSIHGR